MPVLVAVSHATWGRGNREKRVSRRGASGGAARSAKRGELRHRGNSQPRTPRGRSPLLVRRVRRPPRPAGAFARSTDRVEPSEPPATGRRGGRVRLTRPLHRAVETRSRPLDHARFRVVARVAKNVSEASRVVFADSMGDRLRGRRRTLESGSWARQASRTPSEICGDVCGGSLVSGTSETRREARGGRDTSASPRLDFAIPSGEKATVRVARAPESTSARSRTWSASLSG